MKNGIKFNFIPFSPTSLMDKIVAYEAKDYRFESYVGHFDF